MLILLRLISWPYFRRHILRTLLTIAGIVLGVAVFVGMHTANQTVLFAFPRTVDRIAGKTELQVMAGETGFDEEILEKVQSASTVRVAVPVIEAAADTGIKGEGSLLILGVDMTGDRSLRDYNLDSGDEAAIDDPLIFLAQPDSIMLTRSFAEKNHLGVNSQLALGTVGGMKRFTVRGIMKSSGLTSAFGGNLAIMDVYAAQRMFGRGRKFDRIDLALKPGRTIAEGEAELRALLGAGFQVDPPSGRGQQFEQMLAAYSIMVAVSSVFALIPALNAARVDPVQALQKGKYQVLSAGESRLRAALALVLAGVSAACLMLFDSRPIFYFGYFLLPVVALLLSPMLSLALARTLRPFLKWLRPVEGAL